MLCVIASFIISVAKTFENSKSTFRIIQMDGSLKTVG
jgi:hypothetical protein